MIDLIKFFHTDNTEVKVLFRLSSIFLLVFVLYLIASYYIIRTLSLNDIKQYLRITANVTSHDFDYSNNIWDTGKYLSDISISTEIPLYIYSLDGFQIDRLNTIHGFLDTSNYQYASSFATPKTIISPIGEHWRIFSYPISRNNQSLGVIMLAYFDPAGKSEKNIDALLVKTGNAIDREIQLTGDSLDTSKIHQNEIDSNISIEIVDTFNRSILSKGGGPAYIDKSYLQDVLNLKDFTSIRDNKTGSTFLLHTDPIIVNGQRIGIVIAGKGLDQLEQILNNQIKLSVVAGFIAIIIFIVFALYVYRHDIKKLFASEIKNQNTLLASFSIVSFDASEGKISFDGKQTIDIPLRTKQHTLCTSFFKSPKRKWDTDELAEKLGLGIEANKQENTRHVVYDSVMAINAKIKPYIGKDLILLRAKTYYINPDLLKYFLQ